MKLLIRNSKIRYSIAANGIAVFGESLFLLALLAYAGTLAQSELAISISGFIVTIPMILGMFIGILADKTKKPVSALMSTNFVNLIIFLVVSAIFTFEKQLISLISNISNLKDPQFYVFLLILFLVFIVQLIADYENRVFTRVFVKIVDEKDVAEARGIMTGTSNVFYIVAKLVAASLLTIVTYADISYINSFTYFIALIIYIIFYLKHKAFIVNLHENSIKQIQEQKDKNTGISLFNKFKNLVKELISNTKLRYIIKVSVILNPVTVSSGALFYIVINNDPLYQIVNFQFTVSILLVVQSISMILGSFFLVPIVKSEKISYYTLLTIIGFSLLYTTIALIYFGYKVSFLDALNFNKFLNSSNILTIFFILVSSFLMFTISVQQPKTSAVILKELNPNTLATSGGLLSTIFTIFVPLVTFITLAIANSYNIAYAVYFSLALLAISLFIALKEGFSI